MRLEQTVCFSKEDVLAYARLVAGGTLDSDCENLHPVVLPTLMPALAYKQLDIPWKYSAPVMLRKQVTQMIATLYAETIYTAYLELSGMKDRGMLTLVEETLSLIDADGMLCFKSTSNLVTGGLARGF